MVLILLFFLIVYIIFIFKILVFKVFNVFDLNIFFQFGLEIFKKKEVNILLFFYSGRVCYFILFYDIYVDIFKKYLIFRNILRFNDVYLIELIFFFVK